MNEDIRQHYLQLMGITSYMPRAILPGALVSPDYALIESESGVEGLPTVIPIAAIEEDISPVITTERDIMTSQKSSALSLVNSDTKVPSDSDSDSFKVVPISRQAVTFSYLLYEFEHCVAICLNSPVNQQAYRHFIENVFRALGVTPFDTREINWPLSQSKVLDHSLTAAQSYLRTAILANYTEKPLLVFGDLFETLGLKKRVLELACDENLSLEYFAAPCLSLVFNDASSKPSLWAALKQFHLVVTS